ncbi:MULTISPECIES: phosphotransferase [unclassified Breznakia]|uniref:phosphotransferase n=1 Tax=unclassified Breznakia TaxID=2623764 RepID=UPI0024742316|nr:MULTISPECIES: phosphotransferase [unclassified Breznakia]MDH6365894.1 aminoglycoside phosphotransferase (APT) family kinase protein [Breznakia sp. PH1-1]MDH6403174.1 aminoglycoside phosphotransferase (APT) family kinase protein [Breznakia sp. PF1-11]MDH6410883.1 aminoglycoside phosphotransferase (APT) family kinase protein [Breznakia sp. PFB1-11]MDH6413060.1 aminoglycoside phosphotransferase (APT) family kinase protein [Breznakia sp. PFB1-14]MDH6415428.1 aminoglycoside phosphotransferase (A
MKELYKLLEKLFPTKEIHIEVLDKGISNQNYLVRVEHSTYVMRVPFPDQGHVFSRLHEAEINDCVRDLDVPCIYFDPKTGIKLTNYIPDLAEYEECTAENKIERAALLVKALHQKPAPDFDFDPIATLKTYQKMLQTPIYDLTDYQYIVDKVKNIKHTKVLCHNDLVSGNLLFGNDRDYLIDYEYAAANDALFDVMSFLSENNITDPTLRQRFYDVYFDEINEDIMNSLSIWENFHNLLWCTWAMMLYEKRHESIYKEIAKMKYDALVSSHT